MNGGPEGLCEEVAFDLRAGCHDNKLLTPEGGGRIKSQASLGCTSSHCLKKNLFKKHYR